MWSSTPPKIRLAPGELHLWYLAFADNTAWLPNYWQVLSLEEKSKAHSFRFEKDAQQYIQTRAVLRHLLGQYLSEAPSAISFLQNEYGKPYVASKPAFYFNVSHTDRMALLGFTRVAALGVDVENTERAVEAELVARHFFAPAEVERLQSVPIEDLSAAFYRCWTRKEAIIKALGTGLAFPLKEFEVEFAAERPARLLRTHWDEAEAKRWWMQALHFPGNYAGAVAMRSAAPTCCYWKWDRTLLSAFPTQ